MSPRFKDSYEEVCRWPFERLIAAQELIDALDEAEQEAQEQARERDRRRREAESI